MPAGLFGGELIRALRSEPVDAQAASFILRGPLSFEPAGLLHAVQGRIKGAFVRTQDFAGALLDRGHDGVAVKAGAAREDLQNEQVERSLEGVGFGHT